MQNSFKSILIKDHNKDRIEAAIKTAEGKAQKRLLTYDNIVRMLNMVDAEFDIPKTKMKDVEIKVDYNAQHFAKAYKYGAESTWFTAIHTGTAWKLTSVYRYYCTNSYMQVFVEKMPDETKQAIIDRRMRF